MSFSLLHPLKTSCPIVAYKQAGIKSLCIGPLAAAIMQPSCTTPVLKPTAETVEKVKWETDCSPVQLAGVTRSKMARHLPQAALPLQ